MENKNERIENKITLGDFNCTTDEIDRDGRNKKKTLQMLFQLCPVNTHRG